MSDEQVALIDGCRRVLADDPRMRGVWLAGSFGRGDEDDLSDVDLWVAVDSAELDSVLADWPETSDRIADFVLRQQVGTLPIWHQVTPTWLRLDVSFGTIEDVATRTRTGNRALHDPDSLTEQMAAHGEALQPDVDRVRGLTTEFIRVLGLLPVVVGRGEHVVGASGATLLRTMLVQLALEDVAVEDRGGALHLRALLPDERYQEIAGLPPVLATRDAVVEAHTAVAHIFIPLAESLAARCGIEFPADFYAVTRAHLVSRLGVELPTLSAWAPRGRGSRDSGAPGR